MRITNNLLTNNYLSSLNKLMEKQSSLQEKMADQKDLHRPSDDPVKAVRSLKYNSSLAQNEQFSANAETAQSWMETTDGALSEMSAIMTSAKELTIKAISTNTSESWKALATQVDGLINELVAKGNEKIGDRYVFAGQSDKNQPIQRDGDVFTYHGDDNKISMVIKPGSVNPSQDSVNVTGAEVFGSSLQMLSHLTQIKNQLQTGKPDLTWLSNSGLKFIEEDHDNLLLQQTKIGSRMSMYTLAQNMLSDSNTIIQTDISLNDDLDVPAALMQQKSVEAAYNNTLALGAKIMPKSLLDFLS